MACVPKNHIRNHYIENIERFESENQRLSHQNQSVDIGTTDAEVRIEATQLTWKWLQH